MREFAGMGAIPTATVEGDGLSLLSRSEGDLRADDIGRGYFFDSVAKI